MVIRGGTVFGADGAFGKADIAFENGKITALAPPGTPAGEDFDAAGAYVLPGFVDIHTHGCVNSDFCDADPAGLERMLAYYASVGVTSVALATMSLSEAELTEILRRAVPYFGRAGYGAVLRGVNLEGPFFNREKCGAQKSENIIEPDAALFDRLNAAAEGHIRLLDIAPELRGGLEFIRHVARVCTVSLAHTCADYAVAVAAFDAGAKQVTHLFNAMPPFAHREPGVVGAAFDRADYAELITDGVHLHPSVVRAAFRLFGASRICLVSDSMRGAGMPNGEYELGGQTVVLADGRSNLKNGGAIAGSALNLPDCCRRAVSFGIPLADAVRAASLNPARAVGVDHAVGSLEVGKDADILIWDENLRSLAVFAGGKRIDTGG